MESEFPSLFQRYLSTLIDGLVLILSMVLVASVLGNRTNVTGLRVFAFLFILLGYEPLLTAYACTIGQYVIGIRARRVDDLTRRLNLFQAYVRYLVKLPLGLLSFVTMGLNSKRRAIHDFAAKSVMVMDPSRTSKERRLHKSAA